MRRRVFPSPRRWALAAVLFAVPNAFASGAEAQVPGIVNGPDLRLAGTHSFVFHPSGAQGAITWSLDRETVSYTGTRTRTNGVASGAGSVATFNLGFVDSTETIYYVKAGDAGVQDVDTVQVFPAGIKAWFTYRSAGNPDVRVYLVVPPSLSATTRVLMAMHGNSRTASEYGDIWRAWATRRNYVVLCPYYDLQNWPTTGMYQMGNVFSGDDCDGTLNPETRWTFTIDLGIHQRVRDGFALDDRRFDLWGFSGGGQHVHRFMMFEPDAPVRVAIAAGSGWYTAPDLSIGCPYGLHDPLLWFTQQDVMAWTNRTMILMVGTLDTLRDDEVRTTAGADAQGRNRYERCGYMWNKGVMFNRSTAWRRIDVPDVGHQAKPMALAAQSFLDTSLLAAGDVPEPGPRSAVLRIGPNPLTGDAVLWSEGWAGGVVDVEVYDLAGRRVGARTVPVTDGKWRLAWSGLAPSGRLAKGVYLVRVRNRERQVQQKVLVTE